MSRIYEALRQAEMGRGRLGDAMPQVVRPAEPTVEVTKPERAPPKKEPSRSDSPLLFHADPMENVERWVKAYFPDAGLSREDAIRQWLAMASDSRAQAATAGREKNGDFNKREDPSAAPGENTKGHTTQSQEIFRGGRDSNATRSGSYGKSFVNFVAYSVLAILLVRIAWLMPLNKAFPEAGSPLRMSQARAADFNVAPKALTQQDTEVKEARSRPAANITAAGTSEARRPGRIEGIVIGCEDVQPCIVINAQGDDVHPTLSTLTGPDRLVLDFKNALYSPAVRGIAVERGLVKAVRIGGDQKAQLPTTRVVVDLESQAGYELQTRASGFMLKVYPKAPVRGE